MLKRSIRRPQIDERSEVRRAKIKSINADYEYLLKVARELGTHVDEEHNSRIEANIWQRVRWMWTQDDLKIRLDEVELALGAWISPN